MGFIKIPGIDISPANALVGDVKAPKTFFSVAAPIKTGTMPTVALAPGSNAYPQGYHVGAANLQVVDPDLQAVNIVSGITIFGIAGTHGYYDRYYGVTIGLVDAETVHAGPDQSHNKNAPLVTAHKQTYGDAPADSISRRLATLGLVDATNVIASADQIHNNNAPMRSGLEILVDGFVEETAIGGQTDKTAQARSAAANDLNLCPFTVVADKIYIGSLFPFWQVWLNLTTNGAGNWTNSVYYWNGAWTAVVNESGAADFQSGAAWTRIEHTPQGDWALSIIQAMNLYWMKIETTNWVNEAVAPLGGQIFLAIA
jgi:hypothetical protein